MSSELFSAVGCQTGGSKRHVLRVVRASARTPDPSLPLQAGVQQPVLQGWMSPLLLHKHRMPACPALTGEQRVAQWLSAL